MKKKQIPQKFKTKKHEANEMYPKFMNKSHQPRAPTSPDIIKMRKHQTVVRIEVARLAIMQNEWHHTKYETFYMGKFLVGSFTIIYITITI